MHLSDCFTDLIAYVAHGVNEPGCIPASCENLAQVLDTLILGAEEKRVAGDFSETDFDLARFAVFVWVDETIMQSSYAGKDLWRKFLLQKKYYKTTGGGVSFYQKLKGLEMDQNQVREVFYLCLALGYSGKYALSGEDRIVRDRIKTQNLKQLTGTVDGLPLVLSKDSLCPKAYGTKNDESTSKGKHTRWPLWASLVLGLLPVGLFAFLFVLYRFILDNEIMVKVVQ